MQLLLGHTKLESTIRYLGIEVDDALEMAEQTEAVGGAHIDWALRCQTETVSLQDNPHMMWLLRWSIIGGILTLRDPLV